MRETVLFEEMANRRQHEVLTGNGIKLQALRCSIECINLLTYWPVATDLNFFNLQNYVNRRRDIANAT